MSVALYRTRFELFEACTASINVHLALHAFAVCHSPYSFARMDCRDYNSAVRDGIIFG